jgi:hypothetical protein
MNVVKLVTLHVNVAYELVLEAWVLEGAAAGVLGTAVVVGVAAAAQDIGGAQAMAEGKIK